MTFYEAALRVLEAAGQPLSSVEITERSIAQGLLSHVGKTPEQTMLSRLSAMARRARDRQRPGGDGRSLRAPRGGLAAAAPGRAPPRVAQRERPGRRPAGAPAPP